MGRASRYSGPVGACAWPDTDSICARTLVIVLDPKMIVSGKQMAGTDLHTQKIVYIISHKDLLYSLIVQICHHHHGIWHAFWKPTMFFKMYSNKPRGFSTHVTWSCRLNGSSCYSVWFGVKYQKLSKQMILKMVISYHYDNDSFLYFLWLFL